MFLEKIENKAPMRRSSSAKNVGHAIVTLDFLTGKRDKV
jgi:hypothetical protein